MRLDVRWAEEPAQINNRKLLKLKNFDTTGEEQVSISGN
jgi:hypothetical protein